MLSILIVNRDCLSFTKNCIQDLKNQNTDNFDIHVVDNNSQEIGTRSFLMSLMADGIQVTMNDQNRPLCHLWNEHAQKSKNELFCLLNNDVRLPRNFVSDTIEIFKKEPKVGCVIHATNHPAYQRAKNKLEYTVLNQKTRQGWDFSFRKQSYTQIPSQLHFFCGDDFLYENLYQNNWAVAVSTSSPIVHFQGRTRTAPRNSGRDIKEYKKLGYPHNLKHCEIYTKIFPSFQEIQEPCK